MLTGRGDEVPTAKLMAKQTRLQGLIVGSRIHQQEMMRGIEASGVRPVIDSTFEIEEVADAFRHEEADRQFGKICLSF